MEKKGVFALFLILILFSIFAFANPYGNNILDSKKVPSSIGYHELRLIVNGSDLYSVDANENGIIDVAESVLGGGTYWLPAALGIYYMGNAGIGESNPQRKLHISAQQDANIRLQDTSHADNGTAAYIEFYNETDRLGAIGIPGDTKDYLVIATEKGKDIVLSPSGNVGIGTTSPEGILHIKGPDSSIEFENTNAMSSHRASIFGLTDGGLAFSSHSVLFNQPHMVIAQDGNVGIGTINPGATNPGGAKLHVVRDTGGTEVLIDSIGNLAANLALRSDEGRNSFYEITSSVDGKFLITDHMGSVNTRMAINTNGDVGIGTTDPGRRLEVRDDNSTIVSRFYSHNDQYDAAISLKNKNGQISYLGVLNTGTGAVGYLAMANNTNENNIIKSLYFSQSGNVGIGTTAPDYLLTLKGGSNLFKYYREDQYLRM